MKRLLSLLLAVSLVLSLTVSGKISGPVINASAMFFASADDKGEEDTDKETEEDTDDAPASDGLDFSDITYERYDPTHLNELIDEVYGLIDDEANAEQVLSLFEEINGEEDILALSYEVSDLYSYLDATDEYYSDESSWSYDLYCEMDDDIGTLGCAILDSACGDAAREAWTEDEVDYYSGYVEMTDEQLELFSEEEELVAEYDEKSLEELTVTIDGEEYTQSELVDLYYDGTISYDEYYEYYDEISAKMCDELGPIYIELIGIRNQIAESYGYDTYAEYAYTETYDRDYTPEDALTLADEVKDGLEDAFWTVYMAYDEESGLDELAANMPIDEQMANVKAYLAEVDPAMEENFTFMEEHHLYDLEYSDTKLETGFTTYFNSLNVPFLYNQPDGSFYDIMSLVHEFGHYNSFMVNTETAADYQNIDLAEIASQGLELLYTHLYGDMLGEEYAEAAQAYTLYQRVYSVMDGCMYDEFQQRVYRLEDPTVEDINKLFAEVANGYGYNYGDGEEAYDWVLVPHNFESPFYYISYAVSVLPAFEIWEMSNNDFDSACETYTKLVACGEVDTFLETLDECGLTDPFSDGYIEKLSDTICGCYPDIAEMITGGAGNDEEEPSDEPDSTGSEENAAAA